MAGNPLVDQGTINRLKANVILADSPDLNITPSYLGKEGIKLALQGESTTYIPTMIGGVVSQEPYQICDEIMIQLLKSQPLADQYKQRLESNAALGAITVRGDTTQLSPYDLSNCSLMSVRELDFAGGDAGYAITIRGYYAINQDLWGEHPPSLSHSINPKGGPDPMSTKIDKKLNIVIPIESGEAVIDRDAETGEETAIPQIKGYVFSMPLQLAAFEANHELIARTYNQIFTGGYGVIAGPRTAAMIMRDVAKQMGAPEKAVALTTEMRRLDSYASMGKDGWQQIPLEEALSSKLMDEDEWSEVENALAFFTATSAMSKKAEMRPILLGMASFWGTMPVQSSFTDFLASLKTSTATATSPKKAASSVPR